MYIYQRRNFCCAGYDIMAVAALNHAPVAITSVSGSCGGYNPEVEFTDWKLLARNEPIKETFWRPAFWKRIENPRRWIKVEKDEALELAPELQEVLDWR